MKSDYSIGLLMQLNRFDVILWAAFPRREYPVLIRFSNLESRRVISVREVILKVPGIKAPMIAALDNTHTSCDSPLGAAFAERYFSWRRISQEMIHRAQQLHL